MELSSLPLTFQSLWAGWLAGGAGAGPAMASSWGRREAGGGVGCRGKTRFDKQISLAP